MFEEVKALNFFKPIIECSATVQLTAQFTVNCDLLPKNSVDEAALLKIKTKLYQYYWLGPF